MTDAHRPGANRGSGVRRARMRLRHWHRGGSQRDTRISNTAILRLTNTSSISPRNPPRPSGGDATATPTPRRIVIPTATPGAPPPATTPPVATSTPQSIIIVETAVPGQTPAPTMTPLPTATPIPPPTATPTPIPRHANPGRGPHAGAGANPPPGFHRGRLARRLLSRGRRRLRPALGRRLWRAGATTRAQRWSSTWTRRREDPPPSASRGWTTNWAI